MKCPKYYYANIHTEVENLKKIKVEKCFFFFLSFSFWRDRRMDIGKV